MENNYVPMYRYKYEYNSKRIGNDRQRFYSCCFALKEEAVTTVVKIMLYENNY